MGGGGKSVGAFAIAVCESSIQIMAGLHTLPL